jgi:hypothetical protein
MTLDELEKAKQNGLFHPRCKHFVIGAKNESFNE